MATGVYTVVTAAEHLPLIMRDDLIRAIHYYHKDWTAYRAGTAVSYDGFNYWAEFGEQRALLMTGPRAFDWLMKPDVRHQRTQEIAQQFVEEDMAGRLWLDG